MPRKKKELEEMEFDGWDQLEVLAVWGSAEFCSQKLGISPDSLDRRLRERYGHGFAEYKHKIQEPLRINLMKKQYDVAMSGNTALLIWLGKQYLKQSDKVETKNIEISKEDTKILIKEAQELVEKMQ
jgi:hypothetical protein